MVENVLSSCEAFLIAPSPAKFSFLVWEKSWPVQRVKPASFFRL